jgi:hypothetical protein
MIAKITSPQTKNINRLMRLMEDALREANPDKDGAQRLIGQGGDFKADLVKLIVSYSAKAPDFTLAREILGDDFLSPEEVATARGLTYSKEQVAHLERTLPDRETLEWLHRNDYMFVAGSSRELSLLDVRELERSYFYSKEGGWYAEQSEAFARNEKVTCRWYMIRKGIVLNSTSKAWGEQQNLLSDLETAPMAVELVWALTCYKAVRGVYLLGSVYARTSSVDSGGDRAVVGAFDVDGLILYWDGSDRGSSVGVASARKF